MTKRKCLFRITLCLVLGVVTTVGVAWLCVAATDPNSKPPLLEDAQCSLSRDRDGVTREYWRVVRVEMHTVSMYISLRGRWGRYDGLDDDDSKVRGILPKSWGNLDQFREDYFNGVLHGSDQYRVNSGFGLPMRALWYEHFSPGGADDQVVEGALSVEPVWFGNMPPYVPLRVVWPGFVVDTVLYASLWFAVLCTRRFLRWNRKRRGLCPMCKYDLRVQHAHGQDARTTANSQEPQANSSNYCPECGWGRLR